MVPAGPTVKDCVANAAFFFGLVRGFGLEDEPAEACMTFETARDNFYNAARYGLGARIGWNGGEVGIRELLLEELLPTARRGLAGYAIPDQEIDGYLGIVEARVESTQNGAAWQKRWVTHNGMRPNDLVLDYAPHAGERGARAHLAAVTALNRFQAIPPRLLDAGPQELLGLLGGPTLLHLRSGPEGSPTHRGALFVSVLLHGNETSGWYAVRRLLRDFPAPPRDLLILVGNVEAAASGLRTLPGQQDFNRMWRKPTGIAREVLCHVAKVSLLAVVDLHNNTGRNPHYSVLTDFSAGSRGLAALFGDTAVYIEEPATVLTRAFSPHTPNITLELGPVSDKEAARRGYEYLRGLLQSDGIPEAPGGNTQLYRTLARVHLRDGTRFAFTNRESTSVTADWLRRADASETDVAPPGGANDLDLVLDDAIEASNFARLPAGDTIRGDRGRPDPGGSRQRPPDGHWRFLRSAGRTHRPQAPGRARHVHDRPERRPAGLLVLLHGTLGPERRHSPWHSNLTASPFRAVRSSATGLPTCRSRWWRSPYCP